MANETTPLLVEENFLTDHRCLSRDIYDRFSRNSKIVILTIVSVGGVLPLTVGWNFVPSIPQIAKDMESTPAVISLAISISIFAFAIGAIIGATYAGFYGRRSVYLFSLPVLLLGSTGVSLAQSVPELMVWRFIQAMGAGPGGSVGAGTIGDIYKLEERGRAMSVYFLACLLGVALAPLAGGYAAHYASWRLMQLGLGCIGFALWFAVLLWLPETSHPGTRGIEKIDAQSLPRWRSVILNPLRPLAFLRSPVMLSIALVTACSLYVYQVLLIPLSYTLACTENDLPVGTPIIGYICDMTVIKWKNKRNGVWCPEDRLRPAQIPLLVIVPVSCFLSGLFSRYGTGALGLSLNLLCLFFNGFGLEMVWGPCAAYLVDVAHSRSAESVAANAALRSAIVSVGVGSIVPMIEAWGVVATNSLASAVSIVGFVLLWLTIRFGDELRAVVDVGFSTADSN
ncbi:hypothetical protein CC1G_04914 [Coprinopsis cinerea okayama7|uniref:Major facilitator superfamily (MFS) profile domain-containing protein n=1 Tax=Coprinopsis cinerea (strain Okayama-7 / 130 / ATCC MYA-4618 / FGSC 9003) TaxID=240176 RepID=A8PFI4_COPC7|nr:hypothetical protein CC1G_04914 [Coprinopsis cinerea okayama7\|eukprot:XP_001841070.2 hypothetical protein CC1G_04914 [Coprinopsis cinerea okayama7\